MSYKPKSFIMNDFLWFHRNLKQFITKIPYFSVSQMGNVCPGNCANNCCDINRYCTNNLSQCYYYQYNYTWVYWVVSIFLFFVFLFSFIWIFRCRRRRRALMTSQPMIVENTTITTRNPISPNLTYGDQGIYNSNNGNFPNGYNMNHYNLSNPHIVQGQPNQFQNMGYNNQNMGYNNLNMGYNNRIQEGHIAEYQMGQPVFLPNNSNQGQRLQR